MVGTPLVSRVLALLPLFSPLALPTYKSISRSDQLSTSLAGATHRCRASIRTLQGHEAARCQLGSDLKPRSITKVTDLGCWVLPSMRRSLKDQRVQRSHPNKAVDVMSWLTKTSCLLAFSPSTYVGSAPL